MDDVDRTMAVGTPTAGRAPLAPPFDLLESEASALLDRLALVRPFALHETMVPAAALPSPALLEVERFLARGRRLLRRRVERYLAWLRARAEATDPARAQRSFVLLRLEFNALLSQFDLFADVITQRSEHDTGVWLAGLDAAAADGLRAAAPLARAGRLPEVVCYLDRGPGAAIRRARTRLPGGPPNPVAIVRVPRERMVGTAIASSLMHEVGHQGAALLDLRASVGRDVTRRRSQAPPRDRPAWDLWQRWLGEAIPDFWAVASVGVCATLGLIQVVSLPRAFVFRLSPDAPHPVPWIRVLLSASFGARLYPHPQWRRLVRAWTALYPAAPDRPEFDRLLATLPELVGLIAGHRSPALGERSLARSLPLRERSPARLRGIALRWRRDPRTAAHLSPSLAFAVVGQARADGLIGPGDESRLVRGLLERWALDRALGGDPVPPSAAGGRTGPSAGPAPRVRCSMKDRG
ncbi:hypothetical protein [Nocardiopsis sp. YSL2]|uniref:hypothetical protein n=1 Tax=Nocardiopsis sp. YSL2 TaxID=2939492 RepID=UPI0026F46263|nr:hypothetical protein [Nocardiopsis sp. YSL2]